MPHALASTQSCLGQGSAAGVSSKRRVWHNTAGHSTICGLTAPHSYLESDWVKRPLLGTTRTVPHVSAAAASRADGYWAGHSLNNPGGPGDGGAQPFGSSPSNPSKRAGQTRAAPAQGFELVYRPPLMDRPPVMKDRVSKNSLDMEKTPLLLASKLEIESQQGGPSSSSGALTADPSPSNQNWVYLVALCALSVVVCYADRSNISTAVLPMAEQFNWDKAYQGVVLSSFFSGYALTQVLGGQLADKYGGKVVLASGVALWSFFTLVTPEAAALGAAPLIGARVLLGVGEGVAFPSIHSLIARNVPQAYQSTAVGVVTAASYVGTALAFGISPLIISKLGWQWVFYLFAGMALLWLPLWFPVKTADKGALAKKRTEDLDSWKGESASSSRAALDASTSGALDAAASDSTAAGASSALSSTNKRDRGFWALLRRKEVWAICAAQYTQSWGMYGLLNWLPTFFKDFYGVEIADLATYTLAPYIVQGGLGLVSGVIADKLISSGWSIRSVRILLQTLGMLGPAACLMLAVSPAVGASASVASTLITIGLGFSALTLGGVSASHLDVAPRHAGVIFGAGNTAATLAGLISVPFTGYLLQTTGSWPLVFGVTAGHYLLGTILWALWVGDKPLPEDADEAMVARATV